MALTKEQVEKLADQFESEALRIMGPGLISPSTMRAAADAIQAANILRNRLELMKLLDDTHLSASATAAPACTHPANRVNSGGICRDCGRNVL